MHEAETRALVRAVVLLIAISAVRWGWSTRSSPAPVGEEASVLPELLSASRDAAEEETRRSEPLADGEGVDPNRADEMELDRLPGVGPSTASAIVAARDDGAVFRLPEDLLGVRGIGPATLERLRPFLDLGSPPPRRRAASTAPSGTPSPAPVLVDLNRADTAELQALPGIGPAIAERIVAAREKQLFTALEDLVRVRGIGPATVERLRPRATVGPGW